MRMNPDITLSKYGRIIDNDNDYDDLMAILFHYATPMDYCTKTEKRSRQEIKVRQLFMEMEGLGLQQELCPHWNTSPWEFFSPAARLPTLYYLAPGQEIRYQESVEWSLPPTTITTTRGTRKPDHCWRQWWEIRWTRQWLLHSRIDFLNANFFSPALSRMQRSTTSVFWMSSVHMQSLLPASTRTPSVWLSKMLKPVTSTIVGDIVMSSSFLL